MQNSLAAETDSTVKLGTGNNGVKYYITWKIHEASPEWCLRKCLRPESWGQGKRMNMLLVGFTVTENMVDVVVGRLGWVAALVAVAKMHLAGCSWLDADDIIGWRRVNVVLYLDMNTPSHHAQAQHTGTGTLAFEHPQSYSRSRWQTWTLILLHPPKRKQRMTGSNDSK